MNGQQNVKNWCDAVYLKTLLINQLYIASVENMNDKNNRLSSWGNKVAVIKFKVLS